MSRCYATAVKTADSILLTKTELVPSVALQVALSYHTIYWETTVRDNPNTIANVHTHLNILHPGPSVHCDTITLKLKLKFLAKYYCFGSLIS